MNNCMFRIIDAFYHLYRETHDALGLLLLLYFGQISEGDDDDDNFNAACTQYDGYWHDTVVCLSVMQYIVVKQCHLKLKCLNK